MSQGLNEKPKHWQFLVSTSSLHHVFRIVTILTSIFISNEPALSGAGVTPSLMQACVTVVGDADQIPLHFLKERRIQKTVF